MEYLLLPVLLFIGAATLLAVGLLAVGSVLGPRRTGPQKEMPYESGMDPIHDARRRFDVRFHLVAIAFLIFDVELLFLYPWAVAQRHPEGLDRWAAAEATFQPGLIVVEVLVFIALLAVGYIYAWRKRVFEWR